MSSTNFVQGQVAIGGNAFMQGVFAGVQAAAKVAPFWPAKALWMGNSMLSGSAFGAVRGEALSPGGALLVGGAQMAASLAVGAAIGGGVGVLLPMVAVGAATFLAGEAALWAYENNFIGLGDGADAAAEFGQRLMGGIMDGLQDAMQNAGDFANDFRNAASEFAQDMLGGLRDHFDNIGDDLDDLFAPGGPLGPGGPMGPLGQLFAPDGPLFGPGGLFSPDGPLGPNPIFGPGSPLAPGWFDPDGPFFFPPISPLVFDFDGDGLDLISIDQSTAFFDLNLNGIAERTAWIGPDDGFLAIDRNGDGLVNDLTELFGGIDVDGFTRLTELDSNNDGVIDQGDALFAQLLVWRDADGDGVTDAGETSQLVANGVISISLDDIFIDRWEGGNWISHESTFASPAGNGAIYDVWFENDQTFTLPTPVGASGPVSDDILTLPQIDGTGSLVSLQEAMTDDAILRDDVIALVDGSAGLSASQLLTEIESILLRWSGVDDVVPGSRGVSMDARELAFLEAVHGADFAAAQGGNIPGPQASAALGRYYDEVIAFMSGQIISQISLSAMLRSEDFQAFLDHPLTLWAGVGFGGAPEELLARFDEVFDHMIGRIVAGLSNDEVLVEAIDLVQLAAAVGAPAGLARNDVADRFAVLDEAAISPIMRTLLAAVVTNDVFAGSVEAETITAASNLSAAILGFGGNDTLVGTAGRDTIWGGLGDDVLNGGGGSDTYLYSAGDGHDRIVEANAFGPVDRLVLGTGLTADLLQITREGNDPILSFVGHAGSIRLNGEDSTNGAGVEQIVFGDGAVWTRQQLLNAYVAQQIAAGATTLTGFGATADQLVGTAGADTLSGLGGQDTLTGGLGDDILNGGDGADTYLYNAGDGHDRIVEGNAYDGSADRLVLGNGLTADLLQITREGSDLVLSFTGHVGSVRLQNQDSTNGAGVEEIVFGDGVVWTRADLFRAYGLGASTPGNDTINGTTGPDILAGGLGDDVLNGGGGADTYLYNAGDGHDRIVEANAFGPVDRLVLGTGLTADLLQITREGNDPILSFIGHAGSIRLNGEDSTNGAGVEEIVFGDGVVWTRQQLLNAYVAQQIAAGATTLTGFGATADQLVGTAGADTLSGLGGQDTLTGGLGDDILNGGDGADTYLYNAGDGHDRIVEANAYDGSVDRLVLGNGLTADLLQITSQGNDRILSFTGHVGSVRLQNEAGSNGSGVEQIVFGNGVVWTRQQLLAAGTTSQTGLVSAFDALSAGAGEREADYVFVPRDDELFYTADGGWIAEGIARLSEDSMPFLTDAFSEPSVNEAFFGSVRDNTTDRNSPLEPSAFVMEERATLRVFTDDVWGV